MNLAQILCHKQHERSVDCQYLMNKWYVKLYLANSKSKAQDIHRISYRSPLLPFSVQRLQFVIIFSTLYLLGRNLLCMVFYNQM